MQHPPGAPDHDRVLATKLRALHALSRKQIYAGLGLLATFWGLFYFPMGFLPAGLAICGGCCVVSRTKRKGSCCDEDADGVLAEEGRRYALFSDQCCGCSPLRHAHHLQHASLWTAACLFVPYFIFMCVYLSYADNGYPSYDYDDDYYCGEKRYHSMSLRIGDAANGTVGDTFADIVGYGRDTCATYDNATDASRCGYPFDLSVALDVASVAACFARGDALLAAADVRAKTAKGVALGSTMPCDWYACSAANDTTPRCLELGLGSVPATYACPAGHCLEACLCEGVGKNTSDVGRFAAAFEAPFAEGRTSPCGDHDYAPGGRAHFLLFGLVAAVATAFLCAVFGVAARGATVTLELRQLHQRAALVAAAGPPVARFQVVDAQPLASVDVTASAELVAVAAREVPVSKATLLDHQGEAL